MFFDNFVNVSSSNYLCNLKKKFFSRRKGIEIWKHFYLNGRKIETLSKEHYKALKLETQKHKENMR